MKRYLRRQTNKASSINLGNSQNVSISIKPIGENNSKKLLEGREMLEHVRTYEPVKIKGYKYAF